METVNIGFSAPGSINVEVEDPEDVEEVTQAFVEALRGNDVSDDMIETDPTWLAENIHYVDSMDGEVYHEW